MSYIVKNCPVIFYSGITDEAKCWQKWEQFDESCQSCTDCVIKRVIDMCRDEMRFNRKSELALATDINSFFDIEEINK